MSLVEPQKKTPTLQITIDGLRRSGRTTRLVRELVTHCQEHPGTKADYISYASNDYTVILAKKYTAWGDGSLISRNHIRFENGSELSFLLDGQHLAFRQADVVGFDDYDLYQSTLPPSLYQHTPLQYFVREIKEGGGRRDAS